MMNGFRQNYPITATSGYIINDNGIVSSIADVHEALATLQAFDLHVLKTRLFGNVPGQVDRFHLFVCFGFIDYDLGWASLNGTPQCVEYSTIQDPYEVTGGVDINNRLQRIAVVLFLFGPTREWFKLHITTPLRSVNLSQGYRNAIPVSRHRAKGLIATSCASHCDDILRSVLRSSLNQSFCRWTWPLDAAALPGVDRI